MKNKSKVGLSLLSALLILAACQSVPSHTDGTWTADIRSAIGKETPFPMKEIVSGVEYIHLETTDSCLVSNVTDLIMDDEFIFLQNGRTQQILQFTRQGKFLREVGSVGEGPGEYPPYTIENMALDGERKEIYLHGRQMLPLVYSYEGEYLRSDTTVALSIGNSYPLHGGLRVLAGVPITPMQQSPWLVALKDRDNRLTATKVPFPSQVPADACYMKEIHFVPFQNSVLAYTPCNDTIFRVSEQGIAPACILGLKNGEGYNEKLANINELANDHTNASTIDVFTFFETPRFFFFRVLLLSEPNRCYFLRLDKRTGELLSRSVPQELVDISMGFGDSNVLGLENDWDGGVPFCPRYVCKDRVCVQVVNAETISRLEEKGALKNRPAALQVDADDNPVVIVYTFKN